MSPILHILPPYPPCSPHFSQFRSPPHIPHLQTPLPISTAFTSPTSYTTSHQFFLLLPFPISSNSTTCLHFSPMTAIWHISHVFSMPPLLSFHPCVPHLSPISPMFPLLPSSPHFSPMWAMSPLSPCLSPHPYASISINSPTSKPLPPNPTSKSHLQIPPPNPTSKSHLQILPPNPTSPISPTSQHFHHRPHLAHHPHHPHHLYLSKPSPPPHEAI